MVFTSVHTGSRPKNPVVEYFEKEINDLKEKVKRSEEERMNLEFKLADIADEHNFKLVDVVDAHEMKMDSMRLKIKKIRKYAISQESWYHYVVGSIITLVAILIAFAVGFKFCR